MKHKVKGRRFKRNSAQRKALLKHLSEALILHGKIKTTSAKAKELSGHMDGLITIAKKENLAAAKALHSKLSDEPSKKLMKEIVKKYKERHGGYTRIIKTDERKGDAAEMSYIELV